MSLVRDKQSSSDGSTVTYSIIGEDGAVSYTPRGTVSVHFAAPTGSVTHRTPCNLLPDGICWASSLPGLGDRAYREFQASEDALYRELESTYRGVFAEGEHR